MAFKSTFIFWLIFLIFNSLTWSTKVHHSNSSRSFDSLQQSNIIQIKSDNFISSVYNKNYALVIKFCLSWSEECQKALKMFQILSKDIFLWKSVVRLASIDCGTNFDLCQTFGDVTLPSYKFFPPFFNSSQSGFFLKINSMKSSSFRNKLIDPLKKIALQKSTALNWPKLESVLIDSKQNLINLLTSNIDEDVPMLAILEYKVSRIAEKVILDLSSYKQFVSIRGTVYQNLQILEELLIKSHKQYPSILQASKNGDVQVLFSSSSSDEEEKRREMFHFIYNHFVPKNLNLSTSVVSSFLPVHMSDLYKAIKTSLFSELRTMVTLNSTQLQALHGYISVLYKYFPFDNENPRRFMKRVSQWLRDRTSRSNMTVAHIFAIMKAGSDGFIPPVFNYINCVEVRSGYPCSVWLLFHALTVSEYNKHLTNNQETNQHMVLYKMRDYIRHFFNCPDCDNYFNHLASNFENDLIYSNSSILWLWRAHNLMSARISSQNLDNLKHQYPSHQRCPKCYDLENDWDEKQVLIFLQNQYDKKNLIKYNSSCAIKIEVVIVFICMLHLMA